MLIIIPFERIESDIEQKKEKKIQSTFNSYILKTIKHKTNINKNK